MKQIGEKKVESFFDRRIGILVGYFALREIEYRFKEETTRDEYRERENRMAYVLK